MRESTNGEFACPACRAGSEDITNVEEGLSLTVRCRRCGWSATTTNPRHPHFDETAYDIYIELGSIPRLEAIAKIASRLSLSIREVRALVDGDRLLGRQVPASEAVRLRKWLREVGLDVHIVPEPPWQHLLEETGEC